MIKLNTNLTNYRGSNLTVKIRHCLLLFILFACTLSFAAENITANKKNLQKRHPRQIHKVIDRAFADNVFSEICSQHIQFPEIVMKQALLETGWFRNHYLMSRNNLFAFKKVKYLDFITWQRSVEYYKEWQVKNLQESDNDYYLFLVRIKYASDGYIDHLKKIKWVKSCPVVSDTHS